MSNDNNIKKFSAIDIEKYHKGKLSAKERHEMEKAALEDPFLADAMEGYANVSINIKEDVDELKKRLAEKTEGAKVIPVSKNRFANFRLLRVAAMFVFIAGATVLIYFFGINKKSPDIAKTETKKETIGPANNSTTVTTPTGTITDNTFVNPSTTSKTTLKEKDLAKVNKPASEGGLNKDLNKPTDYKNNADIATSNATPVTIPPANTNVIDEQKSVPSIEADKRNVIKEDVQTKVAAGKAIQQAESIYIQKKGIAANKADDQNYPKQAVNIFRGRVTDVSNKGLPFVNLTNLANKAGTYTDANGYFNLTNTDSILNIQVRYVGFENAAAQLRSTVPYNHVMLQENKNNLSEVVVVAQKPNAAARKREADKKILEPEPRDGWDKYDTYLTNNLNIPDDFKSIQSSTKDVVLSFEINKKGKPVNIVVEKSLCNSCDKEAIRLVKDGPGWKSNTKKERAKVTVNF